MKPEHHGSALLNRVGNIGLKLVRRNMAQLRSSFLEYPEHHNSPLSFEAGCFEVVPERHSACRSLFGPTLSPFHGAFTSLLRWELSKE